jgi:NAD(P)-dependent dehydrogenase (short-subunit alcohol dehydrogenase family)
MRNIVVTGGASGIGRALAHRFSTRGDRVAILDRDGDGAARVAAELPEGTAMGLACDVSDPARCEAVLAQVSERWGGVDVLVNNAGLSHHSLFADTDLAVVRRVMEVNFFGAVHCTKAALPSLIERRGTVVALSSVAGFAPLLGRTAYAASKHALHGFFDSLRAEIEPLGVQVLVVCPGFTRTAIDRSALGGDGRPFGGQKSMIGRPLEPEQVAAAIEQAVRDRREQLLVSPVAHASYWLSRLSPRLYRAVMRRSLRGELEGH